MNRALQVRHPPSQPLNSCRRLHPPPPNTVAAKPRPWALFISRLSCSRAEPSRRSSWGPALPAHRADGLTTATVSSTPWPLPGATAWTTPRVRCGRKDKGRVGGCCVCVCVCVGVGVVVVMVGGGGGGGFRFHSQSSPSISAPHLLLGCSWPALHAVHADAPRAVCAPRCAADVKELIPEFFYQPEFLLNSNGFDLGRKQAIKQGLPPGRDVLGAGKSAAVGGVCGEAAGHLAGKLAVWGSLRLTPILRPYLQDGSSLGDVELPPWAHGSRERGPPPFMHRPGTAAPPAHRAGLLPPHCLRVCLHAMECCYSLIVRPLTCCSSCTFSCVCPFLSPPLPQPTSSCASCGRRWRATTPRPTCTTG
jgi:hypothetical protein